MVVLFYKAWKLDIISDSWGPGFDPTPKPRTPFFRKLSSSFFQTSDLKTINLCDVMLYPKKKAKSQLTETRSKTNHSWFTKIKIAPEFFSNRPVHWNPAEFRRNSENIRDRRTWRRRPSGSVESDFFRIRFLERFVDRCKRSPDTPCVRVWKT